MTRRAAKGCPCGWVVHLRFWPRLSRPIPDRSAGGPLAMELGRKFPCFPCFIIFHHFSSFFPIKLGMFQCQVRWQRGNFVSFPWTLLWQSLSSQVYIPLPPQHRQQTGDKFCNVCQYVRKCTSLERFISHLTPAGPAKPGWPPKLAPQIWRNEKK